MTRSGIVLAVVAALALAPAGAAAKGGHRTITIKARAQVDHAQYVDSAPAGQSPGDLLVFTERLFDSHGKSLGSDAASCSRLFDQSFLCTGMYKLPGGQLMVQLLQPGPTGTYDQAITGGTGRFAGARGTVTVAQQPGGDRFTFKIRVDR
jgi:hypothetical protein